MTRSFYMYANFLLVLTVSFGLINSIVHFQLGQEMFRLESYANWFLVGNSAYLVSSLFILRYYHYKKYWFTFTTGTVALLTSLGLIFIFYQMVSFNREFEQLYIPALLFSLSASIPYAVSLVYSKSGKLLWLKTAGIVSIITSLILLTTAIWYLNTQDVQIKATLETINRWVSWASRLLPVLFILNFRYEARLVKEANPNTSPTDFSESLVGLLCVLVFAFTFFFGIDIASQAYGHNRVSGRAKLLALPFEARTYVNAQGDTLPYRLMKPLDYDPKKKYPLVVCLHHGGAHGSDNIRQVEGSYAVFLSNEVNRRSYPAFLFVPQCPKGSTWGGIPNYPSIDSLVFETISTLESEFPIDVKRRYVLGASGGGYGSWHFITARPKMFAAAIPVCGGGDLSLAKTITDVAVWAFHSENDKLVPVSYSRDMIAGIKKAGGHPRYTEFTDAGHNIGPNVESTPGLLHWFFAQKRD